MPRTDSIEFRGRFIEKTGKLKALAQKRDETNSLSSGKAELTKTGIPLPNRYWICSGLLFEDERYFPSTATTLSALRRQQPHLTPPPTQTSKNIQYNHRYSKLKNIAPSKP